MLTIHTDRLELRDFKPGDEAAVHAYGSDPVVTQFLRWGPNSEEDTREFVGRAAGAARVAARRDYELAIVERASSRLIGGCGLRAARPEYREYELGYCLHRDCWRLGYGTEAVRALTTFGVRGLRAHRIFALVDTENLASSRLLERLGYRDEGCQRSDTLIGGRWRDTRVYAVLEGEWVPLTSVSSAPT